MLDSYMNSVLLPTEFQYLSSRVSNIEVFAPLISNVSFGDGDIKQSMVDGGLQSEAAPVGLSATTCRGPKNNLHLEAPLDTTGGNTMEISRVELDILILLVGKTIICLIKFSMEF